MKICVTTHITEGGVMAILATLREVYTAHKLHQYNPSCKCSSKTHHTFPVTHVLISVKGIYGLTRKHECIIATSLQLAVMS